MTVLKTEEFLTRFFSNPNMVWPHADPKCPIAATIQPFLTALLKRGECPVILPRRDAGAQTTALYVVCWDTAHAGRVRPLLEAAVAHHWCPFDGRVAHLDPEDPIDATVLALVGDGTTYVLRPTPHTAAATFIAVERLVGTLRDAPLREPNLPRPVGRMLQEFELALASGAAATSALLLREIEGHGGISHENLAFLQIRRLARLGKERELLNHGSLPTLVYAEPPRLVREAILGAWARTHLEAPLAGQDVDTAVAAVRDAVPDVSMLVDESLANSTDPDASTVCALVAIAREDAALADRFTRSACGDASVMERLLALAATGDRPPAEAGAPSSAANDRDDSSTVPAHVLVDTQFTGSPRRSPVTSPTRVIQPDSWLAWIAGLALKSAFVPDPDAAQDWAPAWSVDAALSEAVDALPELADDYLLAGAALFLQSDDPERPATRTAASLLRRYLLAERFSPHDLGAICALVQVFLRGAPPVGVYREVLGDLRSFVPQWVAVATATRALDIADAIACGPVADIDARSDIVAALLAPLYLQKHRLSETLRTLAGFVTDDIGLDYDWTAKAAESDGVAEVAAPNRGVLLYSLDIGTLARVQKAIAIRWPGLRIHMSSDLVAGPALRQYARSADLIVIATRRAAHAATGFILDNALGASIHYPDGSGSASMLRAVEAGIVELAR